MPRVRELMSRSPSTSAALARCLVLRRGLGRAEIIYHYSLYNTVLFNMKSNWIQCNNPRETASSALNAWSFDL